MEYMEIGSTPFDESCAQLGQDYYVLKATKEMEAYINQLYRSFPDAINHKIRFVKKWFNHDFGQYGEVVLKWDTDDSNADDYAYHIERNLPANWDEEAIMELENKIIESVDN
jgi:hypothetical protein